MAAEPAILLMGPTASGKTGLALALARALPVEIVSVDSALVYRGMDIGTAKPSAEVRAEIPHHLVDLIDPADAYSAGRFRRDALAAMRDIRARGRVPLLAGGTMLYFRALQRGLAELPQADPVVRAELDRAAAARGWPALHAELRQVDPRAAERIQPADSQRIQRALEVWRLTGRPLSELQAAADTPLEGWRLLKLGLAPPSRAALHEGIAARFRDMMAAGFLQEVEQLYARGDLHPGLPAIRAVGYRQLWGVVAGESEVDDAVAAAIIATRRLAKRQMTWLRAENDLHWLQAPEEALALAARWVGAGTGDAAPV